MKTTFRGIVTGVLLASAGAALGVGVAGDAKERCFRAHGRTMDKPAVANIDACWRAHGYLMDRAREVKVGR